MAHAAVGNLAQAGYGVNGVAGRNIRVVVKKGRSDVWICAAWHTGSGKEDEKYKQTDTALMKDGFLVHNGDFLSEAPEYLLRGCFSIYILFKESNIYKSRSHL
jgi:hypothetical protein